jgi:hypothetical protein
MTKPARLLPAPIALAPPAPGDFCCVPISGDVGLAIETAQWLDGDKFQPYDHAEIFTGQADEAGPHGYTVSAYPDGRGRKPLPCPPARLPGSLWSSGIIILSDAERSAITGWATEHPHVRYSFADYGALVLHAAHLNLPGLKGYIGSTGSLICSQFVDTAYLAAGVHLFDDGRWPGFVKPGDLAGLLQGLMPDTSA